MVKIAVSGAKDSGKTTLIERILPILVKKGLKIATIKHDGHDFEPDVPGTDSFRHRTAGAFASAVFSKRRYMVSRELEPGEAVDETVLSGLFPEADLILLEGFKASDYPKIEVVGEGGVICPADTVLAYAVASGLKPMEKNKPVFSRDDYNGIADLIYDYYLLHSMEEIRYNIKNV